MILVECIDYVLVCLGLCEYWLKESCNVLDLELCVDNLDELVLVVLCFVCCEDDIEEIGEMMSELVVFLFYVLLEVGEG